MSDTDKKLSEIIKELFLGVAKILPFIERMSGKTESEKYSFSKLFIIIFVLLSFFVFILFNAYRMSDFAPTFLLVIFVSFGMTIFSPFMNLRLKMKEGGLTFQTTI